MKIIGIPGSVRSNSFNRAFLEWSGKVLSEHGVSIEIIDISQVPVAIGARDEVPSEIRAIKDLVKKSDGVLFSTPQYNYTFPRVLKNTIDWIAFPDDDNSLAGKKAYIMGVSMDSTGVIKAEEKLKAYLVSLGMQVFDGKPVTIDRAVESNVFDQSGGLIDKGVEAESKKVLGEFAAWLKA